MNILLSFVVGLLVLFLPSADALADVINPAGKGQNAWDLFVFGNGNVVAQIMMGLKMLMMPDAGNSGFVTLLLFMATLGFLVLAIGAGFNPSKNFIPMFGYILVVWLVTWMSTKVSANLNITDMVPDGSGAVVTRTVTEVPAIVALPAAMTSQIGKYFTDSLETYMSTPDSYKMGGGVGRFNLFGNMVEETNKVQFQDGNLKMTLSAYIADCAVPAIAMGRLRYDFPAGAGGTARSLYGSDALLHSPDLMKTLESASHKAIMTRLYDVPVYRKPSDGSAAAASSAPSAVTEESTSSAMGNLVTCEVAFDSFKKFADEHVDYMTSSGSEAFASTGVFTPYEDVFKNLMASAVSGGSGGAGNRGVYGSANGMVLQSAMINGMSGAFRNAAMQTGNSEIMLAANITQAEQTQKTSWAIGFASFNNMMGYVFTVLQAFIYALTPMIVVALMIPGMGKSIFVNYAQILIWLILWQPMLSVINFVVTLFAMESTQSLTSSTGGLTIGSKGMLSERVSNSVLAAQFLGTMTPMISWGIVKGAMAFTEFISAGVGTQFANSAAGLAAAGTYQGSALGQNNVGLNNFNTATSATVGTQAVQAFTTAGTGLLKMDGGGNAAGLHGNNITSTNQLATQTMKQLQSAVQRQQSFSEALSSGQQFSEVLSDSLSQMNSTQLQAFAQKMSSVLDQKSNTNSFMTSTGEVDKKALQQAISAATKTDGGVSLQLGFSGKFGGAGGKVGAGMSLSDAAVVTRGKDLTTALQGSAADAHTRSSTDLAASGTSATRSAIDSITKSKTDTYSKNEQVVLSAIAASNWSQIESTAQSVASSLSVSTPNGTTLDTGMQNQANIAAHEAAAASSYQQNAAIADNPTQTAAAMQEFRAGTRAKVDDAQTSVGGYKPGGAKAPQEFAKPSDGGLGRQVDGNIAGGNKRLAESSVTAAVAAAQGESKGVLNLGGTTHGVIKDHLDGKKPSK